MDIDRIPVLQRLMVCFPNQTAAEGSTAGLE